MKPNLAGGDPGDVGQIVDQTQYVRDLPFHHRKKLLELNLKDIPLDPDVDRDDMAQRLGGYSGADVAYLCRKVAEQMNLSEKTVKNYVSSMLAKLGLTSRTQAAVFATRHAG